MAKFEAEALKGRKGRKRTPIAQASSGALIAQGFETAAAQRSASMSGAMANTVGAAAPGTTGSTPAAAAGLMPVSGGGGGGGMSSPVAAKREVSNNLPSISGTPEEQTAQARAYMESTGKLDGPTGGGIRAMGTGGGGGMSSAVAGKTVRMAAEGTVVKASSNRLISEGLHRSVALPGAKMGGFTVSGGQQKGSKGWNGKRLRKAHGAMN